MSRRHVVGVLHPGILEVTPGKAHTDLLPLRQFHILPNDHTEFLLQMMHHGGKILGRHQAAHELLQIPEKEMQHNLPGRVVRNVCCRSSRQAIGKMEDATEKTEFFFRLLHRRELLSQ